MHDRNAPDESSPDISPESLFADWLERHGSDEQVDLEEVCREHPEFAARLRELHDHWTGLGSLRRFVGASDSIAKRLSKRYGMEVDPQVTLDGEGAREDDSSSAVLARLTGREKEPTRYRIKGEVARGGMGTILRVWDEDLRRQLAMKVMLGRIDQDDDSKAPAVEPGTLKRFLEEAQVTGQLDHPGIVPVHELGLESEGRVYFTMKLVKGRDLKEIFDLEREGKEGWTQFKALGVLLKVCEAMSYAHAKGVIHRDLKPANIMVGRFGEVYVMDWGLAKVMGQVESRDIRIRPPDETFLSRILSARDNEEQQPSSPLLTMDGDVVGTPSYMAPEQAAGRLEAMGAHSDVYSVGAMLYHLIVGHMPFVPIGARVNTYSILLRVQDGPPRALHELAPNAPAELVAICEKAMERDVVDRYADMTELAADLTAYLAGRVVHAYETGAWAEARKWVRRNKPLAAALAGVLLLAVGGASAVGYVQNRGRRLAEKEKGIAQTERLNAQESERIALAEKEKVLRLSDVKKLQELEVSAAELWPALPDKIGEMQEWLDEAEPLARKVLDHQQSLMEMRQGGQERTAQEAGIDPADLPGAQELARLTAEITNIEEQLPSARGNDRVMKLEIKSAHEATRDELQGRIRAWRERTFETPALAWHHDVLTQLVDDLTAFADPELGLLGTGSAPPHGWGVRRRLNFARQVEELSIEGGAARAAWDEAVASIADRDECPWYEGLVLKPQLGLLPIGQDPESGMWEFAHLMSGEVAERDAEGRLAIGEDTGMVLVLIPGGPFMMGAQPWRASEPNYDSMAREEEAPPHEIVLDPYFISKYEMTQGQWRWITGSNPASYQMVNWALDWLESGDLPDARHPVERVSWQDCAEVLGRIGLQFPTEAQWERAARGDTSTPWWTGDEVRSLFDAGNLLDRYALEHGLENERDHETWLQDGAVVTVPVGSYAPNPFGLHDTIGNVWEWCRDEYELYDREALPGDGERDGLGFGTIHRAIRGSSFISIAADARSARRGPENPEKRDEATGVRPSRPIDPR